MTSPSKLKLGISPYSSKPCALYFAKQGPLYICRDFLAGTNLVVPDEGRVELDLPLEAGHVLVHLLLTGSYQFLAKKRKGRSRRVDQFSTALRLCVAASQLEMSDFLALAEENLEAAGNQLSTATIIREIEAVTPSALIIPEVSVYLSSRVKDLINGHGSDDAEEVSAEIGAPKTMSEFLLRCIVNSRLVSQATEDAEAEEPTEAVEHKPVFDLKSPRISPSPEVAGDVEPEADEEPPAAEPLEVELDLPKDASDWSWLRGPSKFSEQLEQAVPVEEDEVVLIQPAEEPPEIDVEVYPDEPKVAEEDQPQGPTPEHWPNGVAQDGISESNQGVQISEATPVDDIASPPEMKMSKKKKKERMMEKKRARALAREATNGIVDKDITVVPIVI